MLKRCTKIGTNILSLATLALIAGLSACADGGGTMGRPSAVSNANLTEPRIYRLGAGDKVKVIVFGETDLSGTFDVAASGHIAMPLIGDIPAKGASPNALKEAIARRLSEGYLKNPKVSVEVVSYRPIFVHGEVKTGGELVFKHGLKLRDAIAVAGGYTYRANQNYVLLNRDGESNEIRVDLPSDLIVMPGDNIRVPERFF